MEHLILNGGTIQGCRVDSEASREAYAAYQDEPSNAKLRALIYAIDGELIQAGSFARMTREEACNYAGV